MRESVGVVNVSLAVILEVALIPEQERQARRRSGTGILVFGCSSVMEGA